MMTDEEVEALAMEIQDIADKLGIPVGMLEGEEPMTLVIKEWLDGGQQRYDTTLREDLEDAERTLATLAEAGIVVGEDGEARWHGLTGAEIERLQSIEGVAWDMCGLQSTISHYLRGCHEQGLARRLEVFCDDLRALAAAAGRGAEGEAGE